MSNEAAKILFWHEAEAKLPADALHCEYIESTMDSQFINTGILVSQKLQIYLRGQFASFSGKESWLFGCWNNGHVYPYDAICFDRSTSTLSNCSWIALLANNRTSSGVIEKANGDYKVHRFSAYEDGKIVLDMFPVADDNGVGAMYDLVSKQLFMNCGTGNFEIGQEVK